MSDLTDAELEKWATACRGCESIEDDGFCCSGIRVPALIAALREAREERDEAEKRYVEQLERADAAVGDRDHRVAALLAENRLLREALDLADRDLCEWHDRYPLDGLEPMFELIARCRQHISHSRDAASLTAAEVERVKRLEAENNMLLGARHDPGDVRRIKDMESGVAVAWDALNVAHIVGPSEAIRRARTALHNVLVSNSDAQSVADDNAALAELDAGEGTC